MLHASLPLSLGLVLLTLLTCAADAAEQSAHGYSAHSYMHLLLGVAAFMPLVQLCSAGWQQEKEQSAGVVDFVLDLCGDTCADIIKRSGTKACHLTWGQGCPNDAPPPTFTAVSTLWEMCPLSCPAAERPAAAAARHQSGKEETSKSTTATTSPDEADKGPMIVADKVATMTPGEWASSSSVHEVDCSAPGAAEKIKAWHAFRLGPLLIRNALKGNTLDPLLKYGSVRRLRQDLIASAKISSKQGPKGTMRFGVKVGSENEFCCVSRPSLCIKHVCMMLINYTLRPLQIGTTKFRGSVKFLWSAQARGGSGSGKCALVRCI